MILGVNRKRCQTQQEGSTAVTAPRLSCIDILLMLLDGLHTQIPLSSLPGSLESHLHFYHAALCAGYQHSVGAFSGRYSIVLYFKYIAKV